MSNHNQTLLLADLWAQLEDFKHDKSDNTMNLFLFNRDECAVLSHVIHSYWEEQKRRGMDKTWI
ncbi:hypothetical protein [Cytobacillus firmus]|uniref:hypothetical protein n=1 Tax=Cytobacillus firmus TaxID=1399 RepID=UPI0018CF0A90|nr:hypothetical protein [Cytobacillus firmus]MBG9657074.1 hypothetical protein [Cytobacillus firmus]MED1906747.1 hypothetical protein [Cytobacillus firmus]